MTVLVMGLNVSIQCIMVVNNKLTNRGWTYSTKKNHR